MTETYVPKPHIITPHQMMGAKGIVDLKVYSMNSVGSERLDAHQYGMAGNHVISEIVQGNIDNRLGLGFLIVSRGVANLSLWGGQFPSLLNQTIYEFDDQAPGDIEFVRKKVEEVGSFCCWELGVVAHEGAAWRRYLLSQQSQTDRDGYLRDRFEGIVGK